MSGTRIRRWAQPRRQGSQGVAVWAGAWAWAGAEGPRASEGHQLGRDGVGRRQVRGRRALLRAAVVGRARHGGRRNHGRAQRRQPRVQGREARAAGDGREAGAALHHRLEVKATKSRRGRLYGDAQVGHAGGAEGHGRYIEAGGSAGPVEAALALGAPEVLLVLHRLLLHRMLLLQQHLLLEQASRVSGGGADGDGGGGRGVGAAGEVVGRRGRHLLAAAAHGLVGGQEELELVTLLLQELNLLLQAVLLLLELVRLVLQGVGLVQPPLPTPGGRQLVALAAEGAPLLLLQGQLREREGWSALVMPSHHTVVNARARCIQYTSQRINK